MGGNTDGEIVVADDGSVDGTSSIQWIKPEIESGSCVSWHLI